MQKVILERLPKTKPQEIVMTTIKTQEGLLEIYHYVDSGKVITREKIDTITEVFHPGIIIGRDKYNRIWVAHNHYSNQRPTFNLLEDFCDSKQPLWDNRIVYYTPYEIVQRAIAEVQKGGEYLAINYNCQIFVNLIVRNEHSSEAIDRIADTTVVGGLLISLFGIATKKKAFVATGLTMTGIGLVSIGYSRLRR